MIKKNTTSIDNKTETLTDLFDALLHLESRIEAKLFLKDICTPAELEALEERWQISQLLYKKNYSYRQIQKITNSSLTTITRVARFLNNEEFGGYQNLIQKLNKRKSI